MKHPMHKSRREFLRRLGFAGGAMVVGGSLGLTGCEETTFKSPVAPVQNGLTIEGFLVKIDTGVPDFAFLRTTGGFARVNALGKRILVFRTNDTTASAFSRVCTHAGCDLTPGGSDNAEVVGDRIQCGCHGSVFLIATGERISGPATTGVQHFPVTITGNILTVDLS